MTDYDDTNRGAIWKNDEKTEANPTWADFKGSINVEGKEYWVSAWKRKPGANPKAPALSIALTLKEAKPVAKPEPYDPQTDDDDIPW